MRRCRRCGKVGDDGVEFGEMWLCRECVDGMVCVRCGRGVSAGEVASGSALLTEDGTVYCPRCMELVLPLFEALEDSRAAAPPAEPASSQTGAPVVEPASSQMDAPVVEPATEDLNAPVVIAGAGYPTPFASLRRRPWLMAAGAAIGVFILLMLVLYSSERGIQKPRPPGPAHAERKKQQLLLELQKRVEAILEKCKGALNCELARMELAQLRTQILNGRYPVEGLADISRAFRKIVLVEEQAAKGEYERLLAELEELEQKEEWDEAADAVDFFPPELRHAAQYWQLLERRRERYIRYAKAKKVFLTLKRKVEALLANSPAPAMLQNLIDEIRARRHQLIETPYDEKASDLIRRMVEAMETLKESDPRKRLARLLKTDPFARFVSSRPFKTPFLLREISACEVPFRVDIGRKERRVLRFVRPKAKIVLEFETVQATYGAVVVRFCVPGKPSDAVKVEVAFAGRTREFELRGGDDSRRFAEVTVDARVREGTNTLSLTYIAGTVPLWMEEVRLYLEYDKKTASLQRQLFAKKATEVVVANRRVYGDLKKRWEEEARRWPQRLGVTPLPPAEVGKKLTLTDARLWTLRPVTTMKIKEGVLIIKSSPNHESYAIPLFENGPAWDEYDLLLEFRAKGLFMLDTHVRYNPFRRRLEPGFTFTFREPNLTQLWKKGWVRMRVSVRGRRIKWDATIEGESMAKGEETATVYWRGWFALRLGAGGYAEVRRVEFVLRKEAR